jgi:hypothetical protein
MSQYHNGIATEVIYIPQNGILGAAAEENKGANGFFQSESATASNTEYLKLQKEAAGTKTQYLF